MKDRVQVELERAGSDVRRILNKVMEGIPAADEEVFVLANAAGADVDAMAAVADDLREKVVGEDITFVLNRNMNFTNICFVGCKFCGFSRTNAKNGYFLGLDALAEKAAEAWQEGAGEVCIQGGLTEQMPADYYIQIVKRLKETLPDLHLHAYSPMEIDYGAERMGLSVKEYLELLKEAGLGSIPGTAAEILDDDIRAQLSPVKLTADRWEEIIRTAHQVGLRSTSTMMYGHVEDYDDWARHLLRLRRIQRDTGGFTEFVPLGFIHSNTHIFRIGKAKAGGTEEDHIKMHALARIVFYGLIDSIQVSWVKIGPEGAKKCLQAGANDFGGTLMEENISREAGSQFGSAMTAEEIAGHIEAIGRRPVVRDTLYERFTPFADMRTHEKVK
ncbi:5-amino-6-(D-ribitylamino)uracil--L-tyrosine 4-hydroxyphenyl transferase CofH [Alkalicoccus chagannorensis]|uniref:5-amino-6-(D-ribitylamino)uracil--L-tyrosine 4-hydroxyphenyl transferase CofH n=1 Tax=Alkalicoccus chagannorensis TaxID=427072 RepID=UPI00047BBE79|nr:5-amino-6-(D-ribitylamino)uracil--L-tyrosine 4-hydroxyphenyl transferase CofH [Alkalicoccus chagannorensis]